MAELTVPTNRGTLTLDMNTYTGKVSLPGVGQAVPVEHDGAKLSIHCSVAQSAEILAYLENPSQGIKDVIVQLRQLPPEEQDKILTKLVNAVTGDRPPTQAAGARQPPTAMPDVQVAASPEAVDEVLADDEDDDYARQEREAIQAESAEAEAREAAAIAAAQPKTPQVIRQDAAPVTGEKDPSPPAEPAQAQTNTQRPSPTSAQTPPQGAPIGTPPPAPGQAAVVQAAAQAARDAHGDGGTGQVPAQAPAQTTQDAEGEGEDGGQRVMFVREPGQHTRHADHSGQTVPANVTDQGYAPRVQDFGDAKVQQNDAADAALAEFGFGDPPAQQPAQPMPQPVIDSLATQAPAQSNGNGSAAVPPEVLAANKINVVFEWLWGQGHQTAPALAEAAYAIREKVPVVARTRTLEQRADRWLEITGKRGSAEA